MKYAKLIIAALLLCIPLSAQAAYNTGGGGGGGGGTPGGSNGQIQYNNNGSFGGLITGQTLTTSGGTANITNPQGRSVTGTTDTIQTTDYGAPVNYIGTAATAVTLPNAATAGFTLGFGTTLNNRTNYAVTLTPAAGTINGSSSLTMPANSGCYVYSDSVNWNIDLSQCTSLPIVVGSLPASVRNRMLGISVDGGGTVPVTGTIGAPITIPYNATIIGYVISSNITGSAVVDVWKQANYVVPTNVNSITGGSPPTLTSSNYNHVTSIGSWTTSVSAGDTFVFNLNSISTATRVTVTLYLQSN